MSSKIMHVTITLASNFTLEFSDNLKSCDQRKWLKLICHCLRRTEIFTQVPFNPSFTATTTTSRLSLFVPPIRGGPSLAFSLWTSLAVHGGSSLAFPRGSFLAVRGGPSFPRGSFLAVRGGPSFPHGSFLWPFMVVLPFSHGSFLWPFMVVLPFPFLVAPSLLAFSRGFENYLDSGVDAGWYDCDSTLQRCVIHFLYATTVLKDGCSLIFRWVFIPWLQRELDGYKDRINNTAKRHDRNKVLPHGVPNLIYDSPGDFGALDFKIVLEPGAIDHVRNLYVDLNHAVFELVPRDFGDFLHQCYDELGRPIVDRHSAWNVYLDLHQITSRLYEQLPPMVLPDDNLDDDFLPLLEDHQDLPFHDGNDGAYYMGGVGGGLGLDESHSRQLDILAGQDEPDVSLIEDTNLDESGHAGLVVWEFSDDEDGHVVDEW
ncbi:uncharacterized protein HD556DRAFT_1528414 [Suillus plorans]|uniref:Uncharacterized protein n=1 Tax=Suillus plorans TaxID=116603 RepID=A0A9P7DGE7_9AGAM|nr:uncharacterized protein HD556DRAFT_1528414 [Suillus plorans]KAG1791579.1 hypothetical protein HD556DRAFT_1528414 [Suillus plorans]